MKRIDLIQIKQKGEIFWFAKADPRIMAKLLPKIQAGEVQEAQRPWIVKKVQEISEYVGGKIKFQGVQLSCKGLLPSAPVINIIAPLKVERDVRGDYIMIPETDEEIRKYEETIDAVDGQHRLRAFMDKYRSVKLLDNETYEMGFFIFENLSVKDKRELFLITNEKQDTISKNLLKIMKKFLGLLDSDDDTIFNIIEGLNIESYSPIKNKIIFGEEKIKLGWKETQVSNVIRKSSTYKKLKDLDEEKIKKIISNYLRAWENVYNQKITSNKHIMTKISGFRFMMYLFPCIYDSLTEARESAKIENFEKYITYVKEVSGVADLFQEESFKAAFKGEGGTVKLAHKISDEYGRVINEKLKKFDPSENI